MKGDIQKPVDKTVIVKNDANKKVVDKTKTDSKKGQKDGKKEGRMFKDKSVQAASAEKAKISAEDLTSEGKHILFVSDEIRNA